MSFMYSMLSLTRIWCARSYADAVRLYKKIWRLLPDQMWKVIQVATKRHRTKRDRQV